MGIPGAANPLLLASASGYQIQRSLRFNSADSAYLSRTPASAGNRKTWTWAGWVKRSALVGSAPVFGRRQVSNESNTLMIEFVNNNSLQIGTWSIVLLRTTQVFRDTSAWAHLVITFDTTNATANDRIRFYVNGTEILQYAFRNNPSLNGDYAINNIGLHHIGAQVTNSPTLDNFFNGYLADIHFIDGQALTPSSFGETDGNGVWQPKAYTGSYGTNGFRLNFSDNSTAAALGTDTSGNGNTWTVNNLSVTAGSGNDSLVDTPTNYGTDTGIGGQVRGNYATFNPLSKLHAGTVSFLNGNLEVTETSSAYRTYVSTMAVSSGKFYWEIIKTAGVTTDNAVGILPSSRTEPATYLDPSFIYYAGHGQIKKLGVAQPAGASWGVGDIIGVALNMDAGQISFYKNGVLQVGAITGVSTSTAWLPYCGDDTSAINTSWLANFGQRPFAYAAPSGFKALCTQNLPEGTITTSGTFTGNANADGPFVYLNGVPTAMTVNGNAVTFATHADKLSNGFKLRTNSSSYNTSGSNTYSVSTTGSKFKYARAQPNP
jgi:hypothetical protein